MAKITPYHRKPKPLFESNKVKRKCIWEHWAFGKKDIIRCDKDAVGRFFCKKHMVLAAAIDSCSFDGYSVGHQTGGGYGSV